MPETTDNQLAELYQQIGETNKALHETIAELRQVRTVVQENLSAQRTFNRRVEEKLDKHGDRLQSVELFRERMEATVPRELLSKSDIEKEFDNLGTAQGHIERKVDGIGQKVARIGGGVAVALVVIEILLKVIF